MNSGLPVMGRKLGRGGRWIIKLNSFKHLRVRRWAQGRIVLSGNVFGRGHTSQKSIHPIFTESPHL